MLMSMTVSELAEYISVQMDNMFPDKNVKNRDIISKYVTEALARAERSFSRVNIKYYSSEGRTSFDHLNGDQYAVVLYMLSNTIFRNGGDAETCKKLYLLNKSLHCLDVYYEVELPEIFLFLHPVGTVLGRAKYSDYMIVYQRVSVGTNKDKQPVLGKYLTLHPGSSILGNCRVGDNCRIGADSLLLDKDLGPDTVYIGGHKEAVTKVRKEKHEFWK